MIIANKNCEVISGGHDESRPAKKSTMAPRFYHCRPRHCNSALAIAAMRARGQTTHRLQQQGSGLPSIEP
jgi:hypothetical protein